MFSDPDEKQIKFSDTVSLKIMRMFQRSPLTVVNLGLIFIDIEAKVTKVSLISGVHKHPIYLPPLSVYAIDDVVLG